MQDIFLPKERVYVVGMDTVGTVVTATLSLHGVEYLVRWVSDGEICQGNFYDFELKSPNKINA